ncbi:MAG: septum formation initiator family protein [Candidatus Acetothermia bacterium]
MKNLPGFFQLSLVIILVVALIFLYLWQTWQVIYLQREVNQLEEDLVPIREKKRELQFQVARYFSYDRIERIGKERLGMVEPEIEEKAEPAVP